ncbi:uncharacterized protein LOC116614083 [Nematostella vectensis]|uniref:uncharacterized protein LOC116614083 n=1 Tax=Nematostella vectensis TaxID=45351 RepID=UPI0020770AF1|nr:uncharacterized protein LOC116614083 [Nematostella vectensis]
MTDQCKQDLKIARMLNVLTKAKPTQNVRDLYRYKCGYGPCVVFQKDMLLQDVTNNRSHYPAFDQLMSELQVQRDENRVQEHGRVQSDNYLFVPGDIVAINPGTDNGIPSADKWWLLQANKGHPSNKTGSGCHVFGFWLEEQEPEESDTSKQTVPSPLSPSKEEFCQHLDMSDKFRAANVIDAQDDSLVASNLEETDESDGDTEVEQLQHDVELSVLRTRRRHITTPGRQTVSSYRDLATSRPGLQHLVGAEGEGNIRVRLRGRDTTFQRRFTASDTNELLYQVAISNLRERNITIRNASGRIIERNDDPIDVVDATTLMVFHDLGILGARMDEKKGINGIILSNFQLCLPWWREGGHYQATFSDLCLVVLCPTLAGDPEVRATIDLSNVTQDRIQAAVAEAEARLALTTESIDRKNRRDQQDREYEEGLRRDQERDLQHLVGAEGEGNIRVRLRGRDTTFQRRFTASDTNELLYQVAIANLRERNITIQNASGRIIERNDDPIDVVDATTLMVFHDLGILGARMDEKKGINGIIYQISNFTF